ncbi:hypothetical protein [Burkholderia ubonensis]|uniref:hypothetical protein n=1 Tax=Burkholderia ubonensis TaxID=101571 RepID=UPI000AD33838|nr:hypothetical protein [Burkholderia ubonensis]
MSDFIVVSACRLYSLSKLPAVAASVGMAEFHRSAINQGAHPSRQSPGNFFRIPGRAPRGE